MARQYSTGEIAKLSGLTIRTLQHYDNIDLLPAARAEDGRRVYTEDALTRLEQIVFYRGLGFSLEQIKASMLPGGTVKEISHILSAQKQMLFQQMESMQNSMAAIEASDEILSEGKTPPWSLLAAFMQSLSGAEVIAWKDYTFSEEQLIVFQEHLPTIEDALEFYRTWKRLSIKAAAFYAAGIPASAPIARKLAQDWNAMVEAAAGSNPAHLEAYLAVDQNRAAWSDAERRLIEQAEPYLQEILRA